MPTAVLFVWQRSNPRIQIQTLCFVRVDHFLDDEIQYTPIVTGLLALFPLERGDPLGALWLLLRSLASFHGATVVKDEVVMRW